MWAGAGPAHIPYPEVTQRMISDLPRSLRPRSVRFALLSALVCSAVAGAVLPQTAFADTPPAPSAAAALPGRTPGTARPRGAAACAGAPRAGTRASRDAPGPTAATPAFDAGRAWAVQPPIVQQPHPLQPGATAAVDPSAAAGTPATCRAWRRIPSWGAPVPGPDQGPPAPRCPQTQAR